MNTTTTLESEFFRALNGVVEPAVRAGFGAPCIWPTGLIVIESIGRRSGRVYRSPVVATLVGGSAIASTVRGERSQWLKNLAATPSVRCWVGGRERNAIAIVISPQHTDDMQELPAILRPLAPGMRFLAAAFGTGFAILIPANDGDGTARAGR